ncbi:ATPase, T2SS/T4P/T4SS family, partial [Paenibacillus larvae]
INSWRSLTSERREKKVTMQTLIQEALRNNPDWVIISETRGVEAADMLDSAKTGHAVITTLHAESAASIPTRLRSMIRQSPAYAQEDNILLGKDIVDLLPIGVYMKQKYLNGEIVRRIVDVVEFTGFSQQGVQVRGLYSRWNRWEDVYEEQHFYTSLSDKMKNRLKNAELYHLLPEEFK